MTPPILTTSPQVQSNPSMVGRARNVWSACRTSRVVNGPGGRVTAATALFVYTLWFRVAGIDQTFMLMADQVRDWRVALLPFSELPWAGPASLAGGHSLGPVFYWLMWLTRVVLGPWFDNLPHTGGVGTAILQSGADVALLLSAWRYFKSPVILFAALVFAASTPFDAAVSAWVWNTPVAEALNKITIAVLLTQPELRTRTRLIVVVALAWLSLQAHITGLIISVGVLAWVTLRPLALRQWRAAIRAWYETLAVIAILQVPFFLQHVLRSPNAGGAPNRAIGVMREFWGPGIVDRFGRIGDAMLRYGIVPLTEPQHWPWTALVVVLAAITVVGRARHHGPVWVSVTVVPILTALVIWSPFHRPNDYWFLTLMPMFVVMVALAIDTWNWPARGRVLVAASLLVAVALVQPARFAYSRLLGRLPSYGVLVAGARQIVHSGIVIREVRIAGPYVPGTDPELLVVCLGGAIDPTSQIVAEILENGRVRFTRLQPTR